MLEALEKWQERQATRLRPEPIPVIRTLNDIQAVLQELDPAHSSDGPEVMLQTSMKGEDEKGVVRNYTVQAPTRSRSKRSILLDGFTILQKQEAVKAAFTTQTIPIEVDGRSMTPPAPPTATMIFIDPLIKRWLGGTRRGMLIYWDLADYVYKYDIFNHKLTRVPAGEV